MLIVQNSIRNGRSSAEPTTVRLFDSTKNSQAASHVKKEVELRKAVDTVEELEKQDLWKRGQNMKIFGSINLIEWNLHTNTGLLVDQLNRLTEWTERTN